MLNPCRVFANGVSHGSPLSIRPLLRSMRQAGCQRYLRASVPLDHARCSHSRISSTWADLGADKRPMPNEQYAKEDPYKVRVQQSADQGSLCTSATFAHIPRCTRPVHFGVSLWTVLVRSTSRHPGSSGPLHIPPMQLETEPQGRRPGYPSSLPHALRRFAFAL